MSFSLRQDNFSGIYIVYISILIYFHQLKKLM
jgi:hypothetical protein